MIHLDLGPRKTNQPTNNFLFRPKTDTETKKKKTWGRHVMKFKYLKSYSIIFPRMSINESRAKTPKLSLEMMVGSTLATGTQRESHGCCGVYILWLSSCPLSSPDFHTFVLLHWYSQNLSMRGFWNHHFPLAISTLLPPRWLGSSRHSKETPCWFELRSCILMCFCTQGNGQTCFYP